MAIKEFYIGTCGPYMIDDTDPRYDDPGQVATKSEVPSISGLVSSTRTVNGHALTSNVTVTSADLAGESVISGTVVLAKITSGGTNGSLTFVNGLITAKVDPT
jgi:hypothetical protein